MLLLILFNTKENIVFFYTPSELIEKRISLSEKIRIGGFVKEASLKKKSVNLLDSKLIGNSNKNISKISIRCGSGFYVRSYARDLGDKLDSSAHIFSLKRTKVGKFSINNSDSEDLGGPYYNFDTFPMFEKLEYLHIDGHAYNYDFIKNLNQLKELEIDCNAIAHPKFFSTKEIRPLLNLKKIEIAYSEMSLITDFSQHYQNLTALLAGCVIVWWGWNQNMFQRQQQGRAPA